MCIFKKKKICVTHNGNFHADDLFATAVLSILNNGNIKIIRTRDPKIIEKGDYVYDVGGKWDENLEFFDHHQREGAGERKNGIPYASFGLVWKKYGEKICGNKEAMNLIDERIVCPIDAIDNGVDICINKFKGISPYTVDQIFLSALPTWQENNEDHNIDKIFKYQVDKVVDLLKREIEIAKSDVLGTNILKKSYQESENKKIIILDVPIPRYLYQEVLSDYQEVLYVVVPSRHSSMWKVEAIRESRDTMKNRKLFPENWRGCFGIDGKLSKITNIKDAHFCHRSGFLVVSLSKEGAIKLAEKALLS